MAPAFDYMRVREIVEGHRMPDPGGVVLQTVPHGATTIRATLMPGMSLTLSPGDPLTSRQGERIIELLERIDETLARISAHVKQQAA